MIKKRDAGYCNLKVLLSFLVVYGHLIETRIGSEPALLAQYRLIYTVHMPLYAFLSGLFLQTPAQCGRQSRRMLRLYLCCQAAAVILGGGRLSLFTPWWYLWYLLSLSLWAMAGWGVLRLKRWGRILALLLSVPLALIAGLAPWIGRCLSLSRTLAFFPFFLLGLLTPPELPWHRYRLPGLLGLLLGAAAVALFPEKLPVSVLYQASAYGAMGLAGMAVRALVDCAALGLGFFLLTWIPAVRLPVSRMGCDTLWVYLLHGLGVLLLRPLPLPDWTLAPLALGLVWLLYRALRWRQPLYGIIDRERRMAGDGVSGNL